MLFRSHIPALRSPTPLPHLPSNRLSPTNLPNSHLSTRPNFVTHFLHRSRHPSLHIINTYSMQTLSALLTSSISRFIFFLPTRPPSIVHTCYLESIWLRASQSVQLCLSIILPIFSLVMDSIQFKTENAVQGSIIAGK